MCITRLRFFIFWIYLSLCLNAFPAGRGGRSKTKTIERPCFFFFCLLFCNACGCKTGSVCLDGSVIGFLDGVSKMFFIYLFYTQSFVQIRNVAIASS